MIKKIAILFVCFNLMSCTATQLADAASILLNQAGNGNLSNLDISNGLKQALEIGIGKGSEKLALKDGYFKSPYKILLPEEARKVTDKLKDIPLLGDVENILIQKLNSAAEDAATKAKPIFVNAIKGMTFQDATNILMGSDNAATNYLNNATNRQLYNAFNPVINNSLNKFGAIEYWEDLVTKYNNLPFVRNKVNPRLDDYVTNEALKGLFNMVEKQERKIRTDVGERTTDLLKKVFAKQDGNR